MYSTGVVCGKFNPPHLGHMHLITSAAKRCHYLYVLVVSHAGEKFSAVERANALQNSTWGLPFSIKFIAVEDIFADDATERSHWLWAEYTKKIVGRRIDVVFTSEDYGPGWAHALGAVHVMIDHDRIRFPTSGTACRTNPLANCDYLTPEAMRIAAKRVVLVGSESSGTTTLTKDLAAHYNTVWVPEYGRQIAEQATENGKPIAEDEWDEQLFWLISRGQDAAEERLARECNGLLFCDTDSLATAVWWERYHDHQWHEGLIEAGFRQAKKHDLYILTTIDEMPFEQDGFRDGFEHRQWMEDRFYFVLSSLMETKDIPFIVARGTRQERLAQAIEEVDKLLGV